MDTPKQLSVSLSTHALCEARTQRSWSKVICFLIVSLHVCISDANAVCTVHISGAHPKLTYQRQTCDDTKPASHCCAQITRQADVDH